jgi:hypothetical protein
MTEEIKSAGEAADKKKCCSRGSRNACGAGGAVYGLGLIGAAFYYIQHAGTFMAGVIGLLKALVWPAFVVYRLLGFLGM